MVLIPFSAYAGEPHNNRRKRFSPAQIKHNTAQRDRLLAK